MSRFDNANAAVSAIITALQNGGYTVEEDKGKWLKYSGTAILFTIDTESIDANDNKEMEYGRMLLSILVSHRYNTDRELLTFLKSLEEDVLNDYWFGRSVIYSKFLSFENYWNDVERKSSACRLLFEIKV